MEIFTLLYWISGAWPRKDFMHFYMRLVRLEASSVVDFVVVYIANHSGDIV